MVVWSAPLWSMTTAVPRSGCDWRVEAIHELDEHFLEAGLVVVGVLPDECDHLSVTVGSLTVLATGLIDHAEAIVAIVHVGEQQQEITGGNYGGMTQQYRPGKDITPWPCERICGAGSITKCNTFLAGCCDGNQLRAFDGRGAGNTDGDAGGWLQPARRCSLPWSQSVYH